MNLTVGPLPPAVYWRRRAIVVGLLLLIVILLTAYCGSTGGASAPRRTAGAGPTASRPQPRMSSPSSPIVGGNGGAGGVVSTPAASGGGGAPLAPADGGGAVDQPSASGPCTDQDLTIVGLATSLKQGFYLSMRVKNVSSIACSRDLGGGPQALEVVDPAGVVVWTSDWCGSNQSPPPDVRTFGPGIETILPARPFYWDGSLGRCSGGTPAQAGPYRLIAKVGTEASQPLALIGK